MRARNQIGAIGAWGGNSQITLADIFDVAVDGSADAAGTKIVIDGDDRWRDHRQGRRRYALQSADERWIDHC